MLSEEIKSLKGLNSSIVEGLIQIADIEYERILISYDKLLEFIELIKENNCIIFTGNTYVDYEGDLTQYIEGFWFVPESILDNSNEDEWSKRSCEYSAQVVEKIKLAKPDEELYCDLSFMNANEYKLLESV